MSAAQIRNSLMPQLSQRDSRWPWSVEGRLRERRGDLPEEFYFLLQQPLYAVRLFSIFRPSLAVIPIEHGPLRLLERGGHCRVGGG
jgi:hypothetical protein